MPLGIGCGAAAFLCSGFLAFFAPRFAALPLALFLVLCLAAPFMPCLGFFLPVICRGRKNNHQVALTFDDGPCPQSTPFILNLLKRYDLRATFFVVGRQAEACPELVGQILAHGHTIGNHSLEHDPWLMLRSGATIREDIHACREILAKHSIRPLVFRPPVGITGPRLKNVVKNQGLLTVNYSCRALDFGNRRIGNLAHRILARLKAGDIIMLHDLPPHGAGDRRQWESELEQLAAALGRGWQVVPLAELINQPVMVTMGKIGPGNPVAQDQPFA